MGTFREMRASSPLGVFFFGDDKEYEPRTECLLLFVVKVLVGIRTGMVDIKQRARIMEQSTVLRRRAVYMLDAESNGSSLRRNASSIWYDRQGSSPFLVRLRQICQRSDLNYADPPGLRLGTQELGDSRGFTALENRTFPRLIRG